MKQLRVVVQVRNNLLQQRREELGMNQADLCKAVGVNPSAYSALESMRDSPFGARGTWREPVLLIAAFHGVPVEELFPPEILKMRGGSRQVMFDVTEFAQLAAAGPEELMMLREQLGNMKPMLNSALTASEAQVLTERFGLNDDDERMLSQIGQGLRVSRARAGQLEQRALDKMRRTLNVVEQDDELDRTRCMAQAAIGAPRCQKKAPFQTIAGRRCEKHAEELRAELSRRASPVNRQFNAGRARTKKEIARLIVELPS